MKVLGVDPGASGALALVEGGQLVAVEDMPTRIDTLSDGRERTRVDGRALARLLLTWSPDAVFLEQVNARPGEGPVGAFAFGRNVGVVEGAVGVLGVLATQVPPGNWQRAVRVRRGPDGDIKTPARMRAQELYPQHAHLFRRKKDDGRADAALLATYGWRQFAEL